MIEKERQEHEAYALDKIALQEEPLLILVIEIEENEILLQKDLLVV